MQASSSILPTVIQRSLSSGLKLACLTQTKDQPKASKACICVSIQRGHFDAHAYPEGFAHLLEHMLFSASKDYAEVDALDQHLFEYHGQVNGWTQDQSTHFTLECAPDGFLKACRILLDRLTQPLFLPELIEAEIIAIDAEFKSKQHLMIRQLLSVQKATCNPKHPFARFNTGNKNTLVNEQASIKSEINDIQKRLFEYHRQTLQGSNVSICLGVPESQINNSDIEQLIVDIDDAFTSIDAKAPVLSHSKATQNAVKGHRVYLSEHLGKFIQIKNKQNESQLLCSVIITGLKLQARDSLFIMLTHAIESKHEHSFYDRLKSQGFIYDLQASYKNIDSDEDELAISMQLSAKGCEQLTVVQQILLDYFQFLKNTGFEDWRFREKQKQYILQKQLQKAPGLFENCINVAQALQGHDAKDTLQQVSFNAELAIEYMPLVLSQLNIEQLRLYYISPLAEKDRFTPHYDTPYSISTLQSRSSKTTEHGHTKFAKARQNPFMSVQHRLVQQELRPSELQVFTWHQAELKFYQNMLLSIPNGECYLSISDANMHTSPKQVAIKRVWLACLQEHIARQFFDVELAGIHFRVYAHQHGISLHTGGLSERQLLLCIELINVIRAFKAKPQHIKEHLHSCINGLSGYLAQKPFNRLFGFLNEFYQAPSKTNQSVLDALKALNVEDVLACQSTYFESNSIESLLVGNWTLNSAERFFQRITQRFNVVNAIAKPEPYARDIVDKKHLHFAQPDLAESHLIRHYIPVINSQEKVIAAKSKAFTLQLAARSLVIEKLLSPHVFEVLRQKHKMGYMLGIGYKPIGGFPGVAMYIQSPTHDIPSIYQAMNETIIKAQQQFATKPELLAHLVEDLINQVRPKEPDISQLAARIWMHYDDKQPALAYQDLTAALNALGNDEINAALQAYVDFQYGQLVLTQSADEKVALPVRGA